MTLQNISEDELMAELASRRAAAAQAAGDAATAAGVNARSGLAAGGIGDGPPAALHPMDVARAAIHNGINVLHKSREEAVALGVASVMNAHLRGDERVIYTGRVAPGA